MSDRSVPQIRAACRDDLPRMQAIAVRAWQPIYAAFRDRMGKELFSHLWPDGWEQDKASQIAEHLRRRPEWCLVSELDDCIVGFITFTIDRERKIGEIGNNAVDPAYQSCGVGAMQYHHVLTLFRQQDIIYAKVETGLDPAHGPARAAYTKVGFELMMPSGTYYCKL